MMFVAPEDFPEFEGIRYIRINKTVTEFGK